MSLLKLVEDQLDLGWREVGGNEELGSVEASSQHFLLVLDVGVQKRLGWKQASSISSIPLMIN